MLKGIIVIGCILTYVCGFLWCTTCIPWAPVGAVLGLVLMGLIHFQKEEEESYPCYQYDR